MVAERVVNSSDTYFLPSIVQAAEAASQQTNCPLTQVSSYLINSARVVGGGVIHYAMIVGLSSLDGQPIGDDQIVLNQWAADHLHAKLGDRIVIQYYLRQTNGDTTEVSSDRAGVGITLTVSQILPMSGLGADNTLTPAYKGLTRFRQRERLACPGGNHDSSRVDQQG